MQVLFLEHSVESLARGGPWQLGKIVPGRSAWRPLRDAETEEYGGSSRRVLYGCVVTMVDSSGCSSVPAGENFTTMDELSSFGLNMASSMQCNTFRQLLLTWSRV